MSRNRWNAAKSYGILLMSFNSPLICKINDPENISVFSGQLVEKVFFAREAGILNQFFATGLPGQKTLLSAQVCELTALPSVSARRADVRRKSPFRDFFDGLGRMVCDIFMRLSMVGRKQTEPRSIQKHCSFCSQENTPRSHQIYCCGRGRTPPDR